MSKKTQEARQLVKTPLEDVVSVKLDELFDELGKLKLSQWKLMLAMMLKLVSHEMKQERDRLVKKIREE